MALPCHYTTVCPAATPSEGGRPHKTHPNAHPPRQCTAPLRSTPSGPTRQCTNSQEGACSAHTMPRLRPVGVHRWSIGLWDAVRCAGGRIPHPLPQCLADIYWARPTPPPRPMDRPPDTIPPDPPPPAGPRPSSKTIRCRGHPKRPPHRQHPPPCPGPLGPRPPLTTSPPPTGGPIVQRGRRGGRWGGGRGYRCPPPPPTDTPSHGTAKRASAGATQSRTTGLTGAQGPGRWHGPRPLSRALSRRPPPPKGPGPDRTCVRDEGGGGSGTHCGGHCAPPPRPMGLPAVVPQGPPPRPPHVSSGGHAGASSGLGGGGGWGASPGA